MTLLDHIDLADTASRWPCDFDLDQTSTYSSKMSTADTGNLFVCLETIWIVPKSKICLLLTLLTEMGPAVGKKKGLEIKAEINMPPRLQLLTLDSLALNFL
jgi:hypothetical protein